MPAKQNAVQGQQAAVQNTFTWNTCCKQLESISSGSKQECNYEQGSA